MAAIEECPCSPDTVGHLTAGPICPQIEAFKARGPRRTARPVRLEFRFAKNKENEGFRSTAHHWFYKKTSVAFELAMHWALQVGSKCFDLHKVPVFNTTELRTTDWETSSVRFQAMKEEAKEIGMTYLTDDQIEYIGNHIIEKSFPSYDAFINNCQSFVLELSKYILDKRNNELVPLWVGHKIYEFFNDTNKTIRRTANKIAGSTHVLDDLSVARFNRNLLWLVNPRGSLRRIKASWRAGLIGGPMAATGMSHARTGTLGSMMDRASRLIRSN